MIGLWPCWPVGSNYIVSNVTGQIIEKRDVLSLDDKRDYRRYKLSLLQTKIKSATKKKYTRVKEKTCKIVRFLSILINFLERKK